MACSGGTSSRAVWNRLRSRVRGYIQNGTMHVEYWVGGAEAALDVPMTAPAAANAASTLPSYWGMRSGWQRVGLGQAAVQIPLASSVGYAR